MSDVARSNGNVTVLPRNGRPPGARNLLSHEILEDCRDSWRRDGGRDTLRIMAREDPSGYARMMVSLIPRDVMLSVEQRAPGGLAPEEWETLRRVLDLIKAVVPADADASPGEVFAVIEAALQKHYAATPDAGPP